MYGTRVFLSSVFQGLKGVREFIHDRLERLGYSVWWAEGLTWPANPTPSMIASICLTGLDSCDFYLGVYPSRYGSDPLGLAFTELEYHHAAGRRMPRFLYQLVDRTAQTTDQAIKQRGFLNLLRDRDVSAIQPTRCESVKRLLDAINRDLCALSWATMGTKPSPDMGEALRLWTSAAATNGAYTKDVWATRIGSLEDAQKVSITYARTIGLLHLADSISEFRLHDRKYLQGLEDYLSRWSGVSAWAGLGGVFGQTNVAKARIALAQILERYDRISDLAGAVASGLYSDRKIAAAGRWYQVYRRKGEVPEIWGAIALARGDLTLATSCFEDVLKKPGIDGDNASLHLGYYGVALARKGHRTEAIRQSDAALEAEKCLALRLDASVAGTGGNIGGHG